MPAVGARVSSRLPSFDRRGGNDNALPVGTLLGSRPALLSLLSATVTEAPTPVRVQRIEVELPPRPGPIPASCVRAPKESADRMQLSDVTSN